MELVVMDHDFDQPAKIANLPTIGHSTVQNNAAMAYLYGLRSKGSSRVINGVLNNIAIMLSPDEHPHDLLSFPWHALSPALTNLLVQKLITLDRAPSTINSYLSAIRGVAKTSWIMGQISTDSYQRIITVKGVTGSRLSKGRALADWEVKALISACDREKGSKSLRDVAIIAVLVGCGLRREEAADLQLSSFNRQAMSFNVLGKGNKERRSFLPEWVFERVISWIDEVRGDEPGPLFHRVRRHDDVTSEPVTGDGIYKMLISRGEQANLEKFAPHDLRRTYATKLLSEGEDLITVKNSMGHSNIATTEKYDFRGEDQQRSASKKVTY